MEKIWRHEDLGLDLSLNLTNTRKRYCWRNIQIGEGFADVLTVMAGGSYAFSDPAIYEIKVSRADFLSDIRTEKWRKYLDHCRVFYFAVPDGLAPKSEIPEEAGLIVRHAGGWRLMKKAQARSEIRTLDDQIIRRIAAFRPMDDPSYRAKKEREILESLKIRKGISKLVAQYVRNSLLAEAKLAETESTRQAMLAEVYRLQSEINDLEKKRNKLTKGGL